MKLLVDIKEIKYKIRSGISLLNWHKILVLGRVPNYQADFGPLLFSIMRFNKRWAIYPKEQCDEFSNYDSIFRQEIQEKDWKTFLDDNDVAFVKKEIDTFVFKLATKKIVLPELEIERIG